MSFCNNLLSTSAPKEFFRVKSDTNKLKPKIDRAILNKDHVLAFVVNVAETSENFLVQINFPSVFQCFWLLFWWLGVDSFDSLVLRS